jgi:bifunctional UDP-N-acetylglucosamine pyrophosphorylase/glucosamine-1-phosphate N-acetyltransferase
MRVNLGLDAGDPSERRRAGEPGTEREDGGVIGDAPPLSAIVLAAGEGTRMRSQRPKPLHRLCGRPMLSYVLDSLDECPIERAVVVVGHGAERVTETFRDEEPRPPSSTSKSPSARRSRGLDFVEQHVQRGTGDAVSVGLTAFPDDEIDVADGDVLVLPGDTPLLRPATIAALVAEHRRTGAAGTVLTARLPDATGYGRVVRGKDDRVTRIVEHRDADEDERLIDEINTSIYCFRLSVLAPALRRVTPDNAQGEYYLTDVIEVLHDAGYRVGAVIADDYREIQGVNDRLQLATAEAELRRRTNGSLQRQGVTMVDPDHTYVDATVRVAPDVTLFPNTLLQGRTVVEAGAEIGPDTRLVDCTVGARAVVEKTSGREATIGADAVVGPFAVLDPGSTISDGARTGAFYTAPPPA